MAYHPFVVDRLDDEFDLVSARLDLLARTLASRFGLGSPIVIAESPEDTALVGALVRWREQVKP